MNFSEAVQRYLQLRTMLDGLQITQEDFDQQAGELRVLGPDNAWWQIRASDGTWFRWDGLAWNQKSPPESSFEKPTELGFSIAGRIVEPTNPEMQKAQDEILGTSVASQKPMAASPKSGTLRIFRGKPALEILTEEAMIREIITETGKRYQMINPKPTGSIQGIAFRLKSDGYLDEDVAIEALSPDYLEQESSDRTPAQVSKGINPDWIQEGRESKKEAGVIPGLELRDEIIAPAAYTAPSPRFQTVINLFLDFFTGLKPTPTEFEMAQKTAASLGGIFENDMHQLEMPALGPMAGEALAWWHTLFTTQTGFASPLIESALRPIARRFILIPGQPPLYLSTSRLASDASQIISTNSTQTGLPISAAQGMVLSNSSGLDELYKSTFPESWSRDQQSDSDDPHKPFSSMNHLLRAAAYNRIAASINLSRGLFTTVQGEIIITSGPEKTPLLQEIQENAQKTIDQLAYTADPYLLVTSYLQLAATAFDLSADPSVKTAVLYQKTSTALSILSQEVAAQTPWLPIQAIPWMLVLLTNAAQISVPPERASIESRIRFASDLLNQSFDLQNEKRTSAVQSLFIGRATLAFLQQTPKSPNIPALRARTSPILTKAWSELIQAGDLHLANECKRVARQLD